MRIFRAKHRPQNRWFQRVDSNVAPAKFLASVAVQFGVAPSDVQIVEIEGTDGDLDRIRHELAQGLHDALSVIAATPVSQPPTVDDILSQAISAARTLDELKAALLGPSVRVKARAV